MTAFESTPYVITRQEAAKMLGVDPRTVATGIAEGSIPSIKIGRRVVIPRAKFMALFGDVLPPEDTDTPHPTTTGNETVA